MSATGRAGAGARAAGVAGAFVLGEIAVFIFFSTSGFLVTRSWIGEPHAGRFLVKRGLRIFPALAFAVFTLAFVIGPLTTTSGLSAYVSAPETWLFLLNIFFCSQFGTLPGVFETAPFAGRVDQSLWTLGFEAACYLSVAALGFVRGLRASTLAGLALLLLILNQTPGLRDFGSSGDALFKATMLAPHFLMGAAAALAADRIVLDGRLAAAAAGALILSFLYGGFLQIFALAGTYLILFLAFAPLGPAAFAGRWGDLSYGVFLWGWPIQQMVELARPESGPVANFMLALPVALAAAASLTRGRRFARADRSSTNGASHARSGTPKYSTRHAAPTRRSRSGAPAASWSYQSRRCWQNHRYAHRHATLSSSVARSIPAPVAVEPVVCARSVLLCTMVASATTPSVAPARNCRP